ncbi:MAG: aldehyde dehydrogenase family protein [Puniceicoccales bacterium]|nr:aldehyde dehydrogenase family protein [Puniceicoccales bacterium]
MANEEILIENCSAVDKLVSSVKDAQRTYGTFSQDKVDLIFKAAAAEADRARNELAKMAVAETGMGIVGDKVIKNHFASNFICKKYRKIKTCGVVERNRKCGICTVADPIGVIAGIIPTTNPTSTAIFKALLVLKTRNGIVFSPHPRAKKCTAEAVRIVADAATRAGAPANLIACIEEPTIEATNALMRHPLVDLILATGGPGMVKAAYSSGKPALGVGAGNTPAIIDESANVRNAVRDIFLSKTFDNGMICASEQSVIAVDEIFDDVKNEMLRNGAHILNASESAKVRAIIMTEKGLNAGIVGQSAITIGNMAGVSVPKSTRVLVSEEKSYGGDNPYAHEKLSPILAFFRARDFEHAIEIGLHLIAIGGLGHTAVLHTNSRNQQRMDYFATKIPAGRLLINSPATQGAIGLCNDCLTPSLTLGCGSWGGNSVSENIGVQHLLNHKLVVEKRL